jgi:hypothetical protein
MSQQSAPASASRKQGRGWSSAFLLCLAMLAAAMAQCSEAGDNRVAQSQPSPEPAPSPQAAADDAPPTSATTGATGLKIDLSFVDKKSAA